MGWLILRAFEVRSAFTFSTRSKAGISRSECKYQDWAGSSSKCAAKWLRSGLRRPGAIQARFGKGRLPRNSGQKHYNSRGCQRLPPGLDRQKIHPQFTVAARIGQIAQNSHCPHISAFAIASH